jgi:hypothetical protein
MYLLARCMTNSITNNVFASHLGQFISSRAAAHSWRRRPNSPIFALHLHCVGDGARQDTCRAASKGRQAMVELDTDGPRLFALPSKKRRRKSDVSGPAPRIVQNASAQCTPTPAGLSASTHMRTDDSEADTVDAERSSLAPPSAEPAIVPTPQGEQGGGGEAADSAAAATFRSLGLSEWLDKVCRSLGMTKPTSVQTGCIPAILAGRSVIGTAHTGSGKTAAFALPMLQLLSKDPFGVFGLVLTPTRC